MLVGVLHGPNFNVLERRDPAIYGGLSLRDLEERIRGWGGDLGCDVLCRQTNHEGQYVEWCQELGESAQGLVINSGAWSHYSYAIRDALELARCPFVEVHISDIESREDWRRETVLSEIAAHRVIGKGTDGYREALEFLTRE
ncbi:MAG TPA: type II 3-dehydroquinate dehydratase [Gaiellaceae bacterium]